MRYVGDARARRDARRQGEKNLKNLDLLHPARLRSVTGTGGGGFNRFAHSAGLGISVWYFFLSFYVFGAFV